MTADVRTDLGPRPLAPGRSFWSAFDELVRDQTSPADFCNCYDERALGSELSHPRGDGRRDVLPFLTCHAASLRSGVHAASRAPFTRAVLGVGSSWLPPGLPDRESDSNAPPPRVAPSELQWRSRCTGQRTKRRTRRRPDERGESLLAPGACASKSACGRRSLPRHPLDIRCRRCVRREGRRPTSDGRTDRGRRSDGVPRRTPSSRRPGCLPPPRSRGLSDADCSTPTPSRRSLAHAAHTFSTGCGEVPSRALQAPRGGHPRSVAFEKRAPFEPAGLPCLGLTTQARQRGSDDVAFGGDCLLPPVPTPTAAPDGFYDREPAARCAANFMSGFMPEHVWSRNTKNRRSIPFLSTGFVHRIAFGAGLGNRESACFQGFDRSDFAERARACGEELGLKFGLVGGLVV